MKLDLFKNQWLDIVFDGRNKSYGAYDLRKTNSKVTLRSFLIGGLVFAASVSAPKIFAKKDAVVVEDTTTSTTVKLAPKKEIIKPVVEVKKAPASKVDIVKFVKPKITKAEDADKDPPPPPPPGKKTGEDDVKGNKDAPPPSLEGPPPVTGGDPTPPEDNKVYSNAGLEVSPEFNGGMAKFYEYVGRTYQTPEEDGLKGKVYISFVVEKDGSLTDIKVTRDIGFGTGAEAIRVLKKCPRWKPGIQNGNPVRVLYSLPISIESASE
jgi:periplasmic protein TonB